MPIKFNHLHLKARDPEETAAWYGRAFGLTVRDKIKRPAGDLFLTCKMTRRRDGDHFRRRGRRDARAW